MNDRHTSAEGSLSLELPPGWSVCDDLREGELFAAVLGGQDGDYAPNFTVSSESLDEDETFDSQGYWVGNIVYLQTHPPDGYEELQKGGFTGRQAQVFWASCLRTYEDGALTLAVVQYFIVHARRSYLVNCFTTPADYDELIETFHGIVASFEFA